MAVAGEGGRILRVAAIHASGPLRRNQATSLRLPHRRRPPFAHQAPIISLDCRRTETWADSSKVRHALCTASPRDREVDDRAEGQEHADSQGPASHRSNRIGAAAAANSPQRPTVSEPAPPTPPAPQETHACRNRNRRRRTGHRNRQRRPRPGLRLAPRRCCWISCRSTMRRARCAATT